jgi:hypothetical protein
MVAGICLLVDRTNAKKYLKAAQRDALQAANNNK